MVLGEIGGVRAIQLHDRAAGYNAAAVLLDHRDRAAREISQ